MPDGAEPQVTRLTIPKKLGFLMEPHPYKVAYGGRFGLKTRSFATAILALGAQRPLRVLCCREIMHSIKDSVHEELRGIIDTAGLGTFYDVLDTEIRGKNGTTIIFAGLHGHSAQSIKSYAGIDICWVEEAQTVEKRSWDILIPTIRKPGSEIWVSFNPNLDDDDTWKRWVVDPLPGTAKAKTGWQDAADLDWFPEAENQKRLHCQRTQPDDYPNIWEGVCRSTVPGAIYAREVATLIDAGRYTPTPYNPALPVHTVWDLGWNDAMVVLMVQKPTPTTINIINYLEDSGRTYAEIVAQLMGLRYLWGWDWLPHDAQQHHPTSGLSAQKALLGLGRRVRIVQRSDPQARIGAARMMFPRVYIDTTARQVETGYLGCARLLECLKRYRRNVPRTTMEPAMPVHDFASHAADAFGALAEIVDQIRNERDTHPLPPIPEFRSTVPGMGPLG